MADSRSNASPTLGQRLRYAFDNTMSRGASALIAWLGVVTLVFLAIATTLVWATRVAPPKDGAQPRFVDLFWANLMRALDSGTVAGDTGSWAFLLSMLAVTLGGIFIVSTLIGTITSGIDARVTRLRKGRSKVIENGHTVVIGWSTHVFTIVSELVTANANQSRSSIVILGAKDKVEMEDALRVEVPHPGRTRIVCRAGSGIDLGDIDMVSVQTSKSIIVIAPEGEPDPDAHVIKAILAITNGPNRRKEPYHIVAEIQDPANLEAAALAGGSEVELVLVGDLISRITVQTCRQSGLSIVHTELLDFGGDEIYFKPEPALRDAKFGDALHAYEDSSLIGLRKQDGQIRLNPPMDELIEDGDEVIAISQDDDTVRLSGKSDFDVRERAIRMVPPAPPKPERALILGWNWRAPRIVAGLDEYVAKGSEVVIVAELAEAEQELRRECGDFQNQTLRYVVGDTTSRRMLESLDVGSFDHIILLCSDRLDPQRADARVLVTLLHLRDIGERSDRDLSIVSEMLDVKNRDLAEVTKVDDFIVSERLVSLMLAQVSENKALNAVFQDLFDPEGTEIYVKPAAAYVTPDIEVNFHTVVEAARRRGEIAIGYKLADLARDAAKSYGVVVNPDKSRPLTLSERDRVIVLAES